MGETVHRVNGIDICAEVRGPDDGVPLLLVMGLGAQLVTTEKDAVRLPADFRPKVLVVPVRLELADWALFDRLVAERV